jgi:lysophospholipase L1-like esterase
MKISAASPLHYLALGDSITVGVGSFLNHGYAVLYRRYLQHDLKQKVLLKNLGKNGWTSQDLLDDLLNNQTLVDAIKKSQIITLSIGGNDLIQGVRNKVPLKNVYTRFDANFQRIDKIIKKIKNNGKEPYILRYLEIYNPKPNDPLAKKWISRFNKVINQAKDQNTRIARTYRAFEKEGKKLLFIDQEHPNNQGHQAIARSLQEIGYGPLSARN